MANTIHAIYENGSFRPTEPVDLPEQCHVELEVRAVSQEPKSMNNDTVAQPSRHTTWDDISANKLIIGSAPANEDEEELELTGDDFLF